MPGNAPPGFRIGELSRRTGVSPQLLRAWESRYGLLRPARTGGGYRLYADLARLAAAVPLGLGGPGATQSLAHATGARLPTGDPVTEAQNARAWAD